MIQNLHDKFVKERLSEKENAIDFLKVSLPEKLKSKIALETIETIPNQFMTKAMKEIFSDVFFKCKSHDGSDSYCNILIEHKSYEDPYVAFQLCEYLSSAYRKQLKDKEALIPILPIVFTHHSKTWKYKSMGEFFDNYIEEIKSYIPKFEVIFFNVQDLNDDQIYAIRSVAIRSMIMTQKYITNPIELIERMEKIYESLQTEEERNSFNTNFVYILLSSKNQDKIIEIIEKDSLKNVNKVFMSLYEEITIKNQQIGIQKGEQIGIQKGEQIGIQKGEQIGQEKKTIEFVLKLHDFGNPIESIAEYTSISVAKVNEILEKHNRI